MDEPLPRAEDVTAGPDLMFGLEDTKSCPHIILPHFSDLCTLAGIDDVIPQATYQFLGSNFDDAMNDIQMDTFVPSLASTHLETPDDQQGFVEMQPAQNPSSKRKDANLISVDTYTEVCGVYSAGMVPPTKHIRDKDYPYHCPRCDNTFSSRKIVKTHFISCIAKHGNPDALRWNDHVNLKPARQGGPRDHVRSKVFQDTLNAYSGVTIPSKLSQIDKFVAPRKEGAFLCPVCGGGPFSRAHHIKSHFITCVKKHGNPMGARWDGGRGAKRIGKLLGERDAIATAPATISSKPTPVIPQGDQLSRLPPYQYDPASYATVGSQGYPSDDTDKKFIVPLHYALDIHNPVPAAALTRVAKDALSTLRNLQGTF